MNHNVRNWVVSRPTGPDVAAAPFRRQKLGGKQTFRRESSPATIGPSAAIPVCGSRTAIPAVQQTTQKLTVKIKMLDQPPRSACPPSQGRTDQGS